MICRLATSILVLAWLAVESLAVDVVELKIAEKGSLKPQASRSTDRFKIVLDRAVADSAFLVFFANATGQVELESSHSDGDNKTHLCSGLNAVSCVFPMAEMKALIERAEGFRLTAISQSNPDAPVQVAVYASDHLLLQNSTRQTVMLKDVAALKALVTFDALPQAEKIRLQIKAHPKREFSTVETYLNYNKEDFPSPQAHDFQFAHMDSYRTGFVAYSGESVFCGPSGTCSYRLLIETDGIASFQFSAVQGFKREAIETEYRYVASAHKFDRSEADSSRIYRLDVSAEKFKAKDVKVSLIAISGQPNLYVNPELVPEYSPMSIWKETGGASKSIVVPWSERSQGQHKIAVAASEQTLFIMVQGSIRSTYYLKVQAVDADNAIEKLATGSKEQFFTPYGKIKNFQAVVRTVVRANAEDAEVVKGQQVKVSLHSFNKHVEL